MMSDCLLAIFHKKEYIWIGDFVDRGRFLLFLELWSFRLYLGASSLFFFGSWCILFLFEVYMIGGDIIFLFLLLVLHCATLIIHLHLWGYSWYISFYFMLCEIKNLFCFTCIFHKYIYVIVMCYRSIQVDSSCCCPPLQLIDSSYVEFVFIRQC